MNVPSEARGRLALIAAAALTAALVAAALLGGIVFRSSIAFHLAAGLPPEALVVSRPTLALGPLAVAGPAIPVGLEAELISDARVRLLVAEEALVLPARVSGSLAGHAYASDVAVLGISESAASWLAPGLDSAAFHDGRPLAVVVPRLILDAYNNSFAEANGLPGLTEGALLGRSFFLEIGHSSLSRAERPPVTVPVRLAAFTPRADVAGIVVPREFVREMHRRFEVTGHARRLIVVPATSAAGEELADQLRKRGCHVAGPIERLRSVRFVDYGLGLGLALAAGVLGLFAVFTSFFAAMAHILARREESELYHHLGLSRLEIIRLFAARLTRHASFGGVVGAAIGLILAASAGFFLDRFAPGFLAAPPGLSAIGAAWLGGAFLPLLATALGATLGAALVIPRWEDRR
jgi:hypothetical protein